MARYNTIPKRVGNFGKYVSYCDFDKLRESHEGLVNVISNMKMEVLELTKQLSALSEKYNNPTIVKEVIKEVVKEPPKIVEDNRVYYGVYPTADLKDPTALVNKYGNSICTTNARGSYEICNNISGHFYMMIPEKLVGTSFRIFEGQLDQTEAYSKYHITHDNIKYLVFRTREIQYSNRHSQYLMSNKNILELK